MQRECPECYEKWAAKEGHEAAWRFWTGTQYLYHGYPVRRLHYVVSLMPYDDESLDDLRDRARKIGKRHGIVGGLLVPHTHRLDDEGSRELDGTIHFHGIGIAPGNIEAGGTPADNGAVFKVIPDPGSAEKGKPTYRGFRKYSEVKRCVQYLLSHCAIIEGKHALTWWGLLSYNMLSSKKLEDFCPAGYENLMAPKGVKCPKCGSRDTEPCLEWDSVPRVGEGRKWAQGFDWVQVEVHPLPNGPPPEPYLGRAAAAPPDHTAWFE